MEEEEQRGAQFKGVKLTSSEEGTSAGHETDGAGQGRLENEVFMASDAFCSKMCGMISKPDVEKITEIQLEALSKFQSTNAKFSQFNRYSFDRYEKLNIHFQNHTRMIIDMKKDLDIIFRRIRNLKGKLSKQYGNAFAVTSSNIQKLEEELEADSEDHQEEKPQTLQQSSLQSDNNTKRNVTEEVNDTTDQPVETNVSVANSATGLQTNYSKKESLTVSKHFGQVDIKRPVLRPELSSSDDNYNCEESDEDTDDQHISSSRNKERTILDDGGKSSEVNNEQTDLKLSPQDSKGSQVYKMPLRPEISSSDESLEDDTDDDNDGDESETNVEKYAQSPTASGEELAINTQKQDTGELCDGTAKEN